MTTPVASVIIPSHNRCASLERVLVGLAAQTPQDIDFEVIVVLDGAVDDSVQMLQRWQDGQRLPALRWISQAQQGQATARNAGAQKARGAVIVFLDDDVIPSPGLLPSHLRWHQKQKSVAVLGDYPFAKSETSSWYHVMTWIWWVDVHYARSQPGHILSYRDFWAGNFSLRRDDFLRVGGFDSDFRGYGGEDYDLGYRLLKAGIPCIVDPQARADHYHVGSAIKVLNNMRSEGKNDVLLGQRHPELRAGLRLVRQGNGMRAFFYFPTFCCLGMMLGLVGMACCERLHMRGNWRRLFGKLRHGAYWRGVQERLKTWTTFKKYCDGVPEYAWGKLDITDGLPAQLPVLSRNGPCELVITAAGREIGYFFIEEPIAGDAHAALAEWISSCLKSQVWNYLAENKITPWERTA